jgi:hypothetical protein
MRDVDWHFDGANLAEPKPQEQELRSVPHDYPDLLTFHDAEGLKSGRDLIRRRIKIAVAEDLITAPEKIAVTVSVHFCLESSVDYPFGQNVRV